jgi:hypothetical protein
LFLNIVCIGQLALLAVIILALISVVSLLVIFIAVTRYLKLLTVSVPWSLIVNISLLRFPTFSHCLCFRFLGGGGLMMSPTFYSLSLSVPLILQIYLCPFFPCSSFHLHVLLLVLTCTVLLLQLRQTGFCSLLRPLAGLTVVFLGRHSESFVQIAQPMYLITLHMQPHLGGDCRFSYRLTATTETPTLAFQ